MPILRKAGETVADKRHAYFFLVDPADGITPAPGEAGGVPAYTVGGATWITAGVGPLVSIGDGTYYALIPAAAFATAGAVVRTRYGSATAAMMPGDSFQVVGFDPDSDLGAKLSRADVVVDRTVTPWALVWVEDGTGALGAGGVELMRKTLKDTTGANLTSADQTVGELT